MTMDGRTSVALLTFALSLGCAGCVTTQSQTAADNTPAKSSEAPVVAKNDGPKRTPQATTALAFGKLKEVDADSESAKSNPELQARLRDEARRAYQKALEIDKNNLEAARRLAGLYVKTGDYDRAFELYRKAIKNNPKEAILLYDLGMAHKRRQEFPDSLRCFTKALEMEPQNRDFLKMVGFTLAWTGKCDQALSYLERAYGGNKALAHCNIARVLIEQHEDQRAREHLAIARRESPDLPEANALLAWLDKSPRAAGAQ
jgi:tetratricopeptide (TPR) repeat protein